MRGVGWGSGFSTWRGPTVADLWPTQSPEKGSALWFGAHSWLVWAQGLLRPLEDPETELASTWPEWLPRRPASSPEHLSAAEQEEGPKPSLPLC